MKKKDITISWFLLGFLTLITAYIFIFPMLWGISTSLKSEVEFLDVENWGIIPNDITFEHFIYMFKKSSMKLKSDFSIKKLAFFISIFLITLFILKKLF